MGFDPRKLVVEVNRSGLQELLVGEATTTPQLPAANGSTCIEVPLQMKRRGVEAKLFLGADQVVDAVPDPNLVELIANAHRWLDALTKGGVDSIAELAARENLDANEISRMLPLAFLMLRDRPRS